MKANHIGLLCDKIKLININIMITATKWNEERQAQISYIKRPTMTFKKTEVPKRAHPTTTTMLLLLLLQLLTIGNVASAKRRVKNDYPPRFKEVMNAKLEQSLQSPIQSVISSSSPGIHGRRTQEENKAQNIRILFETTALENTIANADAMTKIRGQAIIDEVLPTVAFVFSQSLKVLRTKLLNIPKDACFGYFTNYIPDAWMNPGLSDVDLVMFISSFETLGNQNLCKSDSGLSTLAVSSPCNLESTSDRPVVGFANICLDANTLGITNGKVNPEDILMMEDIVQHELTHVMGLNSALYKYYRSAFDNSPLTPRRGGLFGSQQSFNTKTFECVNGQSSKVMDNISENTLVFKEENVRVANNQVVKRGYYEMVLPTVTQVARNQFNCQSLTGARIENQPTSNDCIGSHFDERYFFDDIMSALYDEHAAYFSPLVLAMLEDTGWYLSDFEKAENPAFGLGRGCGFVKKECLIDGNIPNYSKGYFCNKIENTQYCGPSHHYRAKCDLMRNQNPGRVYFPPNLSDLGPQFTHADWCPMIVNSQVSCDNEQATKIDAIEVFDSASRCMNVEMSNGALTALCVRAYCDQKSNNFVFNIGTSTYICGIGDEGKMMPVTAGNKSYRFICPPLTQACPDFFCPGMCSGKGTCVWKEDGNASCECFDATDTTPGCFKSPINNPKPNASYKMNFSLVSFLSIVFIIFKFLTF